MNESESLLNDSNSPLNAQTKTVDENVGFTHAIVGDIGDQPKSASCADDEVYREMVLEQINHEDTVRILLNQYNANVFIKFYFFMFEFFYLRVMNI